MNAIKPLKTNHIKELDQGFATKFMQVHKITLL